MKTGQLFWGTLLVTVGVLFLLVKQGVITSEFYFIWDLWPLLFIFWGLFVISKGSKVKPFLSFLFAVFIGFLIYGSIYNLTTGITIHDDDDDYHIFQKYSEEFNPEIKYANLRVDAGAGSFLIKDPTEELIYSNAKGSLAEYYYNTTYSDSTAWIEIEYDKHEINLFNDKIRNRLEIQLNENPIWDLTFNLGAAKSKFDLEQYKVRNLVLNTGATKNIIKLGNKFERTYVNVDMGAVSLEIHVPETSGCKLAGDMVLVAKDLKGFNKNKSGVYVTENYEDAESRVIIDIDGGVSSLKIKRY